MLEKWEKQPGSVGLLVGFVAMPLLWWLRSRLIYLAFGYGSPSSLDFIAFYCIWGAIPGAICGRGVSQALFAWRQQDGRKTKSNLLWHGGVVFVFFALFIAYRVWLFSQMPGIKVPLLNSSVPLWFSIAFTLTLNDFPFQCASLMLFIGLSLRSRPSKSPPFHRL